MMPDSAEASKVVSPVGNGADLNVDILAKAEKFVLGDATNKKESAGSPAPADSSGSDSPVVSTPSASSDSDSETSDSGASEIARESQDGESSSSSEEMADPDSEPILFQKQVLRNAHKNASYRQISKNILSKMFVKYHKDGSKMAKIFKKYPEACGNYFASFFGNLKQDEYMETIDEKDLFMYYNDDVLANTDFAKAMKMAENASKSAGGEAEASTASSSSSSSSYEPIISVESRLHPVPMPVGQNGKRRLLKRITNASLILPDVKKKKAAAHPVNSSDDDDPIFTGSFQAADPPQAKRMKTMDSSPEEAVPSPSGSEDSK